MAGDDILAQLYFSKSSPNGFSSSSKLLQSAKRIDPSMTKKQVQDWLNSHWTPSKYQTDSRKIHRPTFLIGSRCDTLDSDLADMRRLQRFNRGYSWFCIIVDLFTRQIVGIAPMKSKSSKDTASAINDILTDWYEARPECKFRIFLTDGGKEYQGSCKQIYDKFSLKHVNTVDTDIKVSLAEKLISMVKTRLWKMMDVDDSWEWVSKLSDCIAALNNSFNRNIKMTPNQAYLPQNQYDVWKRSHQPNFDSNILRIAKRGYTFKFDVGTIARIRTSSGPFNKKYESSFSTELFRIVSRHLKSFVPMYQLADYLSGTKIIGSFSEDELRKFTTPKSQTKTYEIKDRRISSENRFQVQLPKRGWTDYKALIHESWQDSK